MLVYNFNICVLKAPVRTTSDANLSVAGENRPNPAEEITSRMITPIRHLSQVKVCMYVCTYYYKIRLIIFFIYKYTFV